MARAWIESALRADAGGLGAAVLSLTEDQWFDRKSIRIEPRGLAHALIGLANADGGTLVVGLHRGRVEGTDRDPEHRNSLMQAGMDHCIPPVRVRSELVDCLRDDGAEDHLLVLEVTPAESVVHRTPKDEVFLRVGDETRKLSFAQRQELEFDRGPENFETRLSTVRAEDLDWPHIEHYAQSIGAPDPGRVLRARGLMSKRTPTVAGALLFGRRPQDQWPEAYVRVLRYVGTEAGSGARQQLSADRRHEGPIVDQLVAARESVQELQPRRRALGTGGRFESQPLVPQDAWLEGLVNAVIHRSYSIAGDHVRVSVFDDRIQIASPGRFPGIVALEAPGEAPRFARNPRIARVCADLAWGQELGEGIRRMRDEMRLAQLSDPLYRQTAASVVLTLSGVPVERELAERLPARTREILRLLREAGPLGTGEIQEAVGATRPTIRKDLSRLRDEGLIGWSGSSERDPRASWFLRTSDA